MSSNYLSPEEAAIAHYLQQRRRFLQVSDRFAHDESTLKELKESRDAYLAAEKGAVLYTMRPLMDAVEKVCIDESTLRRACRNGEVRSELRHGRWYVFEPDAVRMVDG